MRRFNICLLGVLEEVNRKNGEGNVWRGNGCEFFIFEERYKFLNVRNINNIKRYK